MSLGCSEMCGFGAVPRVRAGFFLRVHEAGWGGLVCGKRA